MTRNILPTPNIKAGNSKKIWISPGRTWTYDQSVNSRPLYHWATQDLAHPADRMAAGRQRWFGASDSQAIFWGNHLTHRTGSPSVRTKIRPGFEPSRLEILSRPRTRGASPKLSGKSSRRWASARPRIRRFSRFSGPRPSALQFSYPF